jgi:DNA-binding NarL/FixJ family response regulator
MTASATACLLGNAWDRRQDVADRSAGRPAELAVLRLLAGGYSNKEIARSMSLADGTMNNHVSEILAKLETRDRTRAVLKAITLKII